ncbi:MAG: NAD(P)/FAD-dependent oxidoreductase [Clostridia bacterium]|nr:NAD(P)/FAD-dependent oxidoreductase [Clostridia bacterium]
MFDLAIIGAGPAGLSAAITARMRNLSCVVTGADNRSGWLLKAHRLDNYPGMPRVSGQDLLNVFTQQAKDLGAEFVSGVVRQVMPTGKHFMLLCESELIEARSVILAMGAARPKPLPGEAENLGTGVSYCATCDGMFFKGKQVAVLSASAQGGHEAGFLAGLAAQVDYYALKSHETDALDDRIAVKSLSPAAIERRDGRMVLHCKAGEERAYDGIFVFRPAVAMDQLLPTLQMDGAFVTVDRRMATNLPGIFACGDVTGQPLQVAKAVGEGNVAAISCADYLAGEEKS